MLLLAFLTTLASAAPTAGWWLPNPYADLEKADTPEVCERVEFEVSDKLRDLLDELDALREEEAATADDITGYPTSDGIEFDEFIEEAGWSAPDPLRVSVFHEDMTCGASRTLPGSAYIDKLTLRPWSKPSEGVEKLNKLVNDEIARQATAAGWDRRRASWLGVYLILDGPSGKTFTYLDCFPEKIECPKPASKRLKSKEDTEEVDIKPIRLELS